MRLNKSLTAALAVSVSTVALGEQSILKLVSLVHESYQTPEYMRTMKKGICTSSFVAERFDLPPASRRVYKSAGINASEEKRIWSRNSIISKRRSFPHEEKRCGMKKKHFGPRISRRQTQAYVNPTCTMKIFVTPGPSTCAAVCLISGQNVCLTGSTSRCISGAFDV